MDGTSPTLLSRMQELSDLAGVIGLATWDQQTYLPQKAHGARGSQLATLHALYHERLTDSRLGDLLGTAEPGTPDEAAMVRVLRQQRDRAVKLPSSLVKELARAQAMGLSAWLKAREAQDVKLFLPALEKLLTLRREQADAYGYRDERYDALLEGHEPGMRVRRLSPVLTQLKARLVPLVEALCAQPAPQNIFSGRISTRGCRATFPANSAPSHSTPSSPRSTGSRRPS